MNREMTRRTFFKTAGIAASVAVVGQSCCCLRHIVSAADVRDDIGHLGPGDRVIISYRKAIKAMRALPSSNPLSWDYQAAIHGTMMMPPMTAWNSCEHGTYFFWSWHRMYLYWFERIVRQMSGDKCWALPYWNWTAENERQLPPMYHQ